MTSLANAIKTLALIKRKPTLDRAAFRAHYENRHVPLALPLLEGLVRYVRYHVLESEPADLPFDVLTAFWYRDKAAADAVFAKLSGEAGKAILADELEFMDKDANCFFAVSERLLIKGREVGLESEDASNTFQFILVARPEGMSRYDSASFLAISHWPRLFEALEEPRFALLRDGFPVGDGDGELPWDCVMQTRAKGYAGLPTWIRSVEAEGFRVLSVRATSHETPLA